MKNPECGIIFLVTVLKKTCVVLESASAFSDPLRHSDITDVYLRARWIDLFFCTHVPGFHNSLDVPPASDQDNLPVLDWANLLSEPVTHLLDVPFPQGYKVFIITPFGVLVSSSSILLPSGPYHSVPFWPRRPSFLKCSPDPWPCCR